MSSNLGLTNQYDRYISTDKFNIITSDHCNVEFVEINEEIGRFLAVAACEDVVIWDLKCDSKHLILKGFSDKIVTCIKISPEAKFLAAGYENGAINIYDLETGRVMCTFCGHVSSVTCLSFDQTDYTFASGAKDCNIVVWDVMSEQGLVRFNEHTNGITQVKFLKNKNILISTSKDSLIKFWNLNTNYCFKTLAAHHSEIWDFLLMKNDKYLVTACSDNELRVWRLINDVKNNNDELPLPVDCEKVGAITRECSERVFSLASDKSQRVLCCIAGNKIEVIEFRDDETAEKKRIKRLKKSDKSLDEPIQLVDEIVRLTVMKSFDKKSRVKSVSLIVTDNKSEIKMAVNVSCNLIELYALKLLKSNEPRKLKSSISLGHRSKVRCVAISHDNLSIASGSHESIKIWSMLGTNTTIETCDSVTGIVFGPYSKHLISCLKNGHLLIIDVIQLVIIEQIPAHSSVITSMCVYNDVKYLVTGSHDCSVKFWKFELVQNNATNDNSLIKSKQLSLLHQKVLKFDEQVLCIKVTPNNKFIAVSLLSSNVQILMLDTLRKHVHLYGHKLPILCMDISYNSSIIVTSSEDKTIKLWGLDFGDCLKSIFVNDNITCLQFVPNSLLLFSCDKSGKVIEWDFEKYKKVKILHEHQGEAYCLAVSMNGNYVVSSGRDNVLRLAEKSDEILVLEDEEENEREKEYEAELLEEPDTVIPGLSGHSLPTIRNPNSEQAASNLFECLTVCQEFENQLKLNENDYSKIQIPIEMQVYKANNIADYVMEVLWYIKSSDLEQALVQLSYMNALQLFKYLPEVINNRTKDQIELIANVINFLVISHYKTFIHNKSSYPILKEINSLIQPKIKEYRRLGNLNYYPMPYANRMIKKNKTQ